MLIKKIKKGTASILNKRLTECSLVVCLNTLMQSCLLPFTRVLNNPLGDTRNPRRCNSFELRARRIFFSCGKSRYEAPGSARQKLCSSQLAENSLVISHRGCRLMESVLHYDFAAAEIVAAPKPLMPLCSEASGARKELCCTWRQ